ncbi:MAG: PhzF family phenazine biosynthesis protein [Lewinellaceae bacterium]|nr:PhzF family phenazine biosynthesis protein [Saprospiraceae bacterium]MCB9340696.1 PhzF family phenazine biosynthesis protein [Lewinellaceae bacterium]
MQLDIFQVDAFTHQLFSGNPAAVIPLKNWLPDKVLQNIAAENNLSETAYFIKSDDSYHLRWFTPTTEVDLCGHATLATAHVLWQHLGFFENEISFHSRSGLLGVKKDGDFYTLNFPTDKLEQIPTPEPILRAMNIEPIGTWKGREDYLILVENQAVVKNLQPDFRILGQLEARGIIVTAQGIEADFVSRCFFPYFGIDEDPVTGSAHTTLTPFWAKRLGKNELTAHQISKRGGLLKCHFKGNRTDISGQAITYLKGSIEI